MNDEERFRQAIQVLSEIDCQSTPEANGIWCIGCICTNILNGSTICSEMKKEHRARSVRLTAEERRMLVAQAKAEEREACAKIADTMGDDEYTWVAAEIRARKP